MTRRMKRVVVSSGLREADIRPPALLSEFKRLSVQDALEFFGDPAQLVEINCPACDSRNSKVVFRKNEFFYRCCVACGSVFVSPRPTEAALANYYANSRASRFRVQHYSRDTAKARRYHLLTSHAEWMGQIYDEVGNPEARGYADLNTCSPEIFDEIGAQHIFQPLLTVDPLLDPSGVCETTVEVVRGDALAGMGAISAFEKVEHQFSPAAYLQSVGGALADGGLFFFTTRTISGFDLQILWGRTPYIFVPEHLNLLSVEGIALLVERCGFELIELSTPGQLDLELVRHAARNDPSIKLPPFITYLLENRDQEAHWDLQEYLQKHRLSSHVRVVVKKLQKTEVATHE